MPDLALTLPLRGLVVYPGMLRAFPVGRPTSVHTVDRHIDEGMPLVVVPQRDPADEDPLEADLLDVGTLVDVLQVTRLPDGSMKVLVEGVARWSRVGKLLVDDGATVAPFRPLPTADARSSDVTALARELAALHEETAGAAGLTPEENELLTATEDEPERLADQVAATLPMTWEQRLALLAEPSLARRLQALLDLAAVAIAQQRIQAEVGSKVQAAMDANQREYHLKEQIKVLRAELGDAAGPDAEADAFEARILEAKMPEEVEREALREVARLRRIATDSAEFNIARTWLETVCDVPWNHATDDDTSLERAQVVLDEDHYGLDKVKERILEYLAVRQLRNDAQGAILCFVGAPGVGKTSLGRSIARAMGRTFARVSLGGIKDESEIRGHRRTYIGSMPGRIVQALVRAGTSNPVIVLDEIDKVGADFRGDPASALLEVLDPEQNHAFSDHYLDVPVDLSKVLFLCTANLVDPIPPALYDRFEIIEIPGYTEEEKVEIARRFLIPRAAEAHGLQPEQLRIDLPALQAIVRDHTREAGLRNFDRQLASLCRKVARQVVEGRDKPARITAASLERYLGPPRFFSDIDDRDETPGVVVGLAWTATGGDILFIECLRMDGTAGLKLTGSLGDVMKESAEAAMSWLRAHAAEIGCSKADFDALFHLHVPAGAIPKDGPSAGVSMVTALASRLTGRPVRPRMAMTGEITLRGKVLPIGGVKEKVLAARRAGIREVLLPRHNGKDLQDIPAAVRRDLTVHLVDTIHDVLDAALEPSAPV
ncbi:MAG: endopeptidase La [Alphaproteobacteria bacterium]|nr:endopeptidase La [Alphaproteobacteria bacterium]